jgi:hypothetical protein
MTFEKNMADRAKGTGLGRLADERGVPGLGVCIWRPDRSEDVCVEQTVGEFLSEPQRQSGEWLIDGGWGGPPGPIKVRWAGGQWQVLGFPPWSQRKG